MKKQVPFLLLCLATLLSTSSMKAQATYEITGMVTGFNNIPLNNVSVVAQKSGAKAATDASGLFSITSSSKETLVFTASGFKDRKVKTNKEKVYKVNLVYDFKPSSFEAATMNNHIGQEVLEKAMEAEARKNLKDYSRYTSIYELISNEVYSVRVSGSAVYNKKVKSMDSNPLVLYVVDDKIVTDISYISPLYVKSIDFIEDVGATLYGSKGANGVLKITLK
jgi:hypothetical protein